MGVRGTLPVVVVLRITLMDVPVFVGVTAGLRRVVMRMTVLAVMVMLFVPMPVFVTMGLPLDASLAFTATAYCTHQSTSSSFTRISSPAVTCSW